MNGLSLVLLLAVSADPYVDRREAMVSRQIVSRGVTDKATLAAMRSVPRHLFVPGSIRSQAYDDTPLPIGHGQTISQPYVVAYMTELLQIKAGSKVLEVGTGSGYQAAILGNITNNVFTVEIIQALGQEAKNRLKSLGFGHVSIKVADGYDGWEEHGPYDAVIVTAAAEYIPPPLVRQLKEGGRMVIPVGSPFLVQTLMLVEKESGKVRTKSLLPVSFVPLVRRP